ncbi:MAG: hypothetical protein K8R69_12485 [Deltaproteobacteria bacterium]|nr:hypothetical protein [Deltaproteobacteria bacterium]
MVRLTAELIRQNPALSAFSDYIEQTLHRAPNPGEIEVLNERPNDGILQFTYIDAQTREAFAAQLNAGQRVGALEVNHGPIRDVERTIRGRRVTQPGVIWVNAHATPINVAGACDTLHAIGGEEESGYTCPAISDPTSGNPPSQFSRRASFFGQNLLANWTGAEVIGWVWKRRSLSAYTYRTLPGLLRPVGTNELTLAERARFQTPVLAAGAITMLSAESFSNQIGLDANAHYQERFALGVYGAYGSMWGMNRLMNRRTPGAGVNATSLAAGLLTSALVDATLGQMWAEGSSERQTVRMGAFLLPQVYQMAFGKRTLALAETRAGSAVTRWGGRALAAGFYADAAYMVWHHVTGSNRDAGRDNLIYRRATQLQNVESNSFSWLFHGLAETVAPSLTQRYLVSGNYVDQARREIEAQASAAGNHAQAFLGHALLMGPTGTPTDANFYRELDLSWLRGDNTLRNIRRADGSELPVADVAEQFNDPDIYRRVIENGTPDQQIQYVQQQFRGFRLSREDVQEILSRIALHHVRGELQDMQYTAGSDQRPLADCFDANGALIAGRESTLLGQVFPGQEINAEQVLALRRVGLARRILELRASDPTGTQLAAYTRIATEIGLADASGNLIEGEETRYAQASLDSHPAPAAPLAPPRPSQGQVLQGILAYGAQHG